MAGEALPPSSSAPPPPGGERVLSLRELGARLWRRRWSAGAVAAAIFLGVMLWTFLVAPRYRSIAVVRIMGQSSQMSLLENLGEIPGLELSQLGAQDDLETEIGVLRSWRINAAVVDSLDLELRLEEPAAGRGRVVAFSAPPEGMVEGGITFTRRSDGRWAVELDELEIDDEPVAVEPSDALTPGDALRFRGYEIVLLPDPPAEVPETIEVEVVPTYMAVQELQEDMAIRQQEAGSRLVQISYTHPDRGLAADVVNAAVREYVAYKTAAERGDTRYTAARLREQVADYADRLVDAEARLQAFQEAERVVAPEVQAEQQILRIAELQMALDALEVEREAVGDLMEIVEARARGEVGPQAYRQVATLPTFISNGAIENILTSLVELENERAELLVLRTPENEDVRQLTRRLRELEEQLRELGSAYVESLDEQIESLRSSLDGIEAELETLPARERRYVELKRRQTLLTETYLLLQQQLKQAEVREEVMSEGVRVVDLGQVAHPDEPVFPKPLVHLALGLILAGTVGMGVALTLELWDDSIQSQTDVQRAVAGLPVLGVLPRLTPDRRPVPPGAGGRRLLARSDGKRAGLGQDPWSPAAEAFRRLALEVSEGGRARVVAVTSPVSGDGKTTIATGLAVAFAQQGRSTLLVDADFRGGQVHRVASIPVAPGVAQILGGESDLDQAVHTVRLVGSDRPLDLLPSGGTPDSPPDLTRPETLERFLDRARERYDRVIVDTPALEGTAMGPALAARADVALLVVRPGRTDREALERSAEAVRRRGGAGIRGVVLNDYTGAVSYSG